MGSCFLSHKYAFYALSATCYGQLGNNEWLIVEFDVKQLIDSEKRSSTARLDMGSLSDI